MLNKFLIIGVLALLASIFFVGVYENDEFSEFGIFTKHKPTTQLFFSSPTGMSDATLDNLPDELKKEEIAYKEFVIEPGVLSAENKYDFSPYLLIQTTLTFIFLGIYRIKFKKPFEKFILPLHFLLNFMISSFVIGGIFSISNIYGKIGLIFLVLILNYTTIFWIRNQKLFKQT